MIGGTADRGKAVEFVVFGLELPTSNVIGVGAMPLDDHDTAAAARLTPRHFNVFLSSPGDVVAERRIVEEVIQTRLAKDAFLRGRVTFDVISWDDPDARTPMPAGSATWLSPTGDWRGMEIAHAITGERWSEY